MTMFKTSAKKAKPTRKKKVKKADVEILAAPYNDYGFAILNKFFSKLKNETVVRAWMVYSGHQMWQEMELEGLREDLPMFDDPREIEY